MELKVHAKRLKIALLASGLLLCAAVFPAMPYGFYVLLKWAVCGTAVYGITAFKDETALNRQVLPLALLAFLFNPLIPVPLTRLTWLIFYLGTALYFLSLSKKF